MRGDGALIKPGLHSNNDKLSACGNLLKLRPQRYGGLRADQRISNVAINLAKIFPSARRQRLLAAGERDSAEQKKISGGNRDACSRAELCEEGGAPACGVKYQAETG